MMTRRQALKKTALATVACAAASTLRTAIAQPAPAATIPAAQTGPFTLPPLPYAYDALEPHIDAQTMRIHHDKHHAAYVANLNKALADWPEYRTRMYSGYVEQTLRALDSIPENIRTAVRNNLGGHYNHSLFWEMMKKDGGGEPKGEFAKAIETSFGNLADFKAKFTEAAMKVFGSGWAWFVLTPDKKLTIVSRPNQDSPITGTLEEARIEHPRTQILLGLDVWEHAYYLKYQNKRADYIAAWWNVVNWDFVAERYAKLKS
jgi:Fe-Mn family superoxide dismutase